MLNMILLAALVLGGVGLVSAGMLAFASRRFAVQENPLIGQIEKLLPGANCGACGFPGCRGLAEAMIDRTELGCPASPVEARLAIAALLGVEASPSVPLKAKVHCLGCDGVAARRATYAGVEGCRAAMLLSANVKECEHGCIGFGDCERVCAFNAISMKDGLAVIDEKRCTGCGRCVTECPKSVIFLHSEGRRVAVACRSTEKGALTRSQCSRGCIGCRKCEKACQYKAIETRSFLAAIDQQKCTRCGECIAACPQQTIVIDNPDAGWVGPAPDPALHMPKTEAAEASDGRG